MENITQIQIAKFPEEQKVRLANTSEYFAVAIILTEYVPQICFVLSLKERAEESTAQLAMGFDIRNIETALVLGFDNASEYATYLIHRWETMHNLTDNGSTLDNIIIVDQDAGPTEPHMEKLPDRPLKGPDLHKYEASLARLLENSIEVDLLDIFRLLFNKKP